MFSRGGLTAARSTVAGVAVCMGALAASAGPAAAAPSTWTTWGSNWHVRAAASGSAASVGKINAGGTTKQRVTVECQVQGQLVDLGSGGKSTMWARLTAPLRGYLTVVAIDIPQDRLPGVPICAGATPPPASSCSHGTYQKRYLGYKRRFRVDHSIARLTWQPKLCRDASGPYRVVDAPRLEVVGPGSLGVGLELRAPQGTAKDVLYRGDVRECVPFSISYSGIGFSGSGCRTVGKVDIRATPVSGGVRIDYRAWELKYASIGYGDWVWTNRVL